MYQKCKKILQLLNKTIHLLEIKKLLTSWATKSGITLAFKLNSSAFDKRKDWAFEESLSEKNIVSKSL